MRTVYLPYPVQWHAMAWHVLPYPVRWHAMAWHCFVYFPYIFTMYVLVVSLSRSLYLYTVLYLVNMMKKQHGHGERWISFTQQYRQSCLRVFPFLVCSLFVSIVSHVAVVVVGSGGGGFCVIAKGRYSVDLVHLGQKQEHGKITV